MRKSAKIISALSVAGLAVVAGSAFTGSNTFAANALPPLTGYATTEVSGATVNSLDYNLNGLGTQVVSVTLELDGDTTASTVRMGFNGGALFNCTDTETGTTTTIYTCTPGAALNTEDLDSTQIVVS